MENLEKQELQTSCMNCANGTCRVEYHEKIGLDAYGNAQGSSCLGCQSSETVENAKVLKKTGDNRRKKTYEAKRI